MLDVLVEGVDVVLGLLARLLLVGLGVLGQEVEEPRRRATTPGCSAAVTWVVSGWASPPSIGSRWICAVSAPPRLATKAIHLPSGDHRGCDLAVGARGELRRIAAVDADPPQVADALVGLPVGVGLDEHHLPAVGRQLRGAHHRHADEVDDRHRPLGQGRGGQDEQHAEQDGGAAKGHGRFLLATERERSPECSASPRRAQGRRRGGCDLRHAPSPPRHHATQRDRPSIPSGCFPPEFALAPALHWHRAGRTASKRPTPEDIVLDGDGTECGLSRPLLEDHGGPARCCWRPRPLPREARGAATGPAHGPRRCRRPRHRGRLAEPVRRANAREPALLPSRFPHQPAARLRGNRRALRVRVGGRSGQMGPRAGVPRNRAGLLRGGRLGPRLHRVQQPGPGAPRLDRHLRRSVSHADGRAHLRDLRRGGLQRDRPAPAVSPGGRSRRRR